VDRHLIHAVFPLTYKSARETFREQADASGGRLAEIPHPLPGANGESLAVDIASWGPTKPEATLLISSGLHGVEGFFGSAVQAAFMKQTDRLRSLRKTRVVVVHALNPWGFSHGRRFDHENIDCNRNFVLPESAFAGSPELYEVLDPFLNPQSPPRRIDAFFVQAIRLIRKYGFSRLQQTIASGQFDFPAGLFFAGRQPSWTQRRFLEQWDDWTGKTTRVVHLDFHTGLGRFGEGQLLLDYSPSKQERDWFERVFGSGSLSIHGDDSSAEGARETRYSATGGIGAYCHQRYAHGSYAYACCEFGTLHPVQMLRRLRHENQGYFHDRLGSRHRARAHRQLHLAFCPNSLRWRKKTLSTALDWLARSLHDLEHDG